MRAKDFTGVSMEIGTMLAAGLLSSFFQPAPEVIVIEKEALAPVVIQPANSHIPEHVPFKDTGIQSVSFSKEVRVSDDERVSDSINRFRGVSSSSKNVVVEDSSAIIFSKEGLHK